MKPLKLLGICVLSILVQVLIFIGLAVLYFNLFPPSHWSSAEGLGFFIYLSVFVLGAVINAAYFFEKRWKFIPFVVFLVLTFFLFLFFDFEHYPYRGVVLIVSTFLAVMSPFCIAKIIGYK